MSFIQRSSSRLMIWYKSKAKFRTDFSSDLLPLFSNYRKVILFLRSSYLFKETTPLLEQSVAQYLLDPLNFDQQNWALQAIDATHKLHPLDYCTPKVTQEWLVNACLRHHKFAVNFPVSMRRLNFGTCFR